MFALVGLSLFFVSVLQHISESQNRIRSSLRNRLSEQAAERVSCVPVANNSHNSQWERRIGLAIEYSLNFCLYVLCLLCCPPQAAESAEQLSEALLEDLLEDTAMAAWAAEADKQLEGMAECRLRAPTVESMLLRMEEIQVRAALQKGPPTEGQCGIRKGRRGSGCYL